MFIANAKTGAAQPLFVDRDSAWIDIYDDHDDWGPGPSLHWLDDGSAFVYLSERDGWRHAYLVSRDGTMRLITPGEYDVMKVSYIDTKGGWLYYYASPDNATQMFLWRIKLDRRASRERLTPAAARGNSRLRHRPRTRASRFTRRRRGASPPVTDLVRLPSHEVVRTLVDNRRAQVASSRRSRRGPSSSPRSTSATA